MKKRTSRGWKERINCIDALLLDERADEFRSKMLLVIVTGSIGRPARNGPTMINSGLAIWARWDCSTLFRLPRSIW